MRRPPEGIFAGAAAAVAGGNLAGLVAFWRFVFARFPPHDRAFAIVGTVIVFGLIVATFTASRFRVSAAALALLSAIVISGWELSALRTMITLHAIRDAVADACRSGAGASREDIARTAGVDPSFQFNFRCSEGTRYEISARAYGRPPVALFPRIWRYDFEARAFYLAD